MENPKFLEQKYNLQNTPEVQSAANRKEIRTGEKVPQNPDAQIQNYLDRFKEIIERKDPKEREMGMRAFKKVLHDKFVIKYEEIPDGYFENQRRIAREQGHGDIEITDEMRAQHAEVIIADQESSLGNWINYLSSEDAIYPDWLKYYAARSVLGMSSYDKEKKSFIKRTKKTVAPFPDLNREALAYVLDAIEKKQAGVKTIPPIDIETEKEEYEKFEKLIQGENFAKLYAWAIEKVTPDSKDLLTNTKGEWVKYDRSSDHMPLVQSLQGHGTGWCTAGESTAQTQLQGGDFYVYYSYDEKGEPTIPRVAIRMQENQIGEVRGIAHEQNLDPYISDVVKEKLAYFPDGKAYEKKSDDMKLLTEIEKKTKVGQKLDKNDLIFLYEIDSKIEGFGYDRDPRIEEIRKRRNTKEDASTVFECLPQEIAWSEEDIAENTKSYVGEWSVEICQKIRRYPNIEHLYETFPDKKIFMQTLETDQSINSPEKAENALQKKNMYLPDWGKDILYETEFSKESQTYELARFTVEQLGFPRGATTDEIYKRAEELGLELCPAEVGPHLRLQYSGKDWMRIAMKQITDHYGSPSVFYLGWESDRLRLSAGNVEPWLEWRSDSEFVFRLHKRADEAGEKNNYE